jgi:hypothetical protein
MSIKSQKKLRMKADNSNLFQSRIFAYHLIINIPIINDIIEFRIMLGITAIIVKYA